MVVTTFFYKSMWCRLLQPITVLVTVSKALFLQGCNIVVTSFHNLVTRLRQPCDKVERGLIFPYDTELSKIAENGTNLNAALLWVGL